MDKVKIVEFKIVIFDKVITFSEEYIHPEYSEDDFNQFVEFHMEQALRQFAKVTTKIT